MRQKFASRDMEILTSLANVVLGKATEESFQKVAAFEFSL